MGHVSLLASGFGGYAGLARLVLLTFGFLGVGGAGVALLFMSSQKRWVPWAYGVVVVALGAFQLLLYKDGAWYQWMIEPVTRRQESLGWTFILGAPIVGTVFLVAAPFLRGVLEDPQLAGIERNVRRVGQALVVLAAVGLGVALLVLFS